VTTTLSQHAARFPESTVLIQTVRTCDAYEYYIRMMNAVHVRVIILSNY